MKGEMLWGALVVPVLLGFFKTELMSLLSDYKIYRNKAVREGDRVELFNPNTGEWGLVEVVDYTFGFQAADRMVHFRHVGSDRKEAVPFSVWNSFRKSVCK